MVPYILTLLCVGVACAIHWFAPKTYWKATLMSTAVILLFSVAALFIFQASGMLVSEHTGESADFTGRLLTITTLIAFFGFLISLFVGWFMRVVRG
ncbi:hypothetical protein D210916BOD24_03150 [Alteromonas sp. D210916BOD_24]|uniref:hypothetical protein n=1 Tax=Alteromonas sp. D210916BOD_24 TaxID=3157618 RepID=UPI00399D487D